MGCDIHSFAEVRRDGRWQYVGDPVFTTYDEWDDPTEPFGWRHYSMFWFLAGVRDPDVPTIAEPRGLPDDASATVRAEYGSDDSWYGNGWHSASWLTLAELSAYDYDQAVITRYGAGQEPLRDVLGGAFFDHLDDLSKLGAPDDVRVVFWFAS